MTCPQCGKDVDKTETEVMQKYGYKVCVTCRSRAEMVKLNHAEAQRSSKIKGQRISK